MFSVAFPVFETVGLFLAFVFVVCGATFTFEACLPVFFFSVELSVFLPAFSVFAVLLTDKSFFFASFFALLSALVALLLSVVDVPSVAVVASEGLLGVAVVAFCPLVLTDVGSAICLACSALPLRQIIWLSNSMLIY